ncbi:MAG: CotH kinase family protein [Oscillospiraceae bacterium]|nr:CotH kinase family protein [Oscillospiraceae bacterium]
MNDKRRLLAGLCATVVLITNMTACTMTEISDSSENVTTTVSSSEEVTTTESDNVPSNIVTQSEATTASEAVTESTEATDEVIEEAESDETGLIVDDYTEDFTYDSLTPDDLYEMYGLSRSERQSFYSEICEEYELPIISVSTENEEEVLSRTEYINCLVEIMNCDAEYVMDATSAEIRVRGNASAYYGDVDQIRENGAPYRIKFTKKQSVLGLNDGAKCRSWVLLKTYNYGVRDHLAFTLAAAINAGMYYVSDSTFVQLYINEEYMGIYLLCEQTQENENRVAITEAEEGYTGTDIGYLVELDNYSSGETWRFMLNYNNESITDVYGTTRVPKKYYYTVRNDIYSEEQLDFIERYFEVCYEVAMRAIKYGEYYRVDRVDDDFTLTLAQDEFESAYDCISQVMDIESFVDMYILYEIVNDQDVGGGSFFFAVDFSETSIYPTLTCVAPWDFSWAYGDYSSDADGGLYAAKFKDDYFVDNWGDRSNPWLILLYSADWFQELVKEKWQERYSYILEALDEVTETVETYADDFNKDGKSRSSSALATIRWTRKRVEYLNTLWG